MKWLNGVLLVCVMALATACTALKADQAREAQADQALSQTASGDVEGAIGQLAPGVDRQSAPAAIAAMRAMLPTAPPPTGRTVNWTHNNGSGGESYRLVREYDYPAHVVLSETMMIKVDGRWLIQAFHIRVATDAELKETAFTLEGKGPLHYGVLAGMIIVPSLVVATVGFALYRRRWGWAFLALFGVMALQLNWATGAWGFMPIHFQLLGAGFFKAGSVFAPWILTVGFPLGAVLFWALGKNRPKPPKASKTAESEAAAGPAASQPDDFTPLNPG